MSAAFLQLVALLVFFQPAGPAGLPTAAEIAARALAASGQAPANETVAADCTIGGRSGHIEAFRSGREFRETTTFGNVSWSTGFSQGQAWRRNENGQILAGEFAGGPDISAASTFGGAVFDVPVSAAVSVDGERYVLTSGESGSHERVYVDRRSWLVVRRDLILSRGTVTTEYGDFRTAGGVTRPFHWATTDGRPEDAAEVWVRSYEAGPVDHAKLAVPPQRQDLVEFPADLRTVELPARFDRNAFIVRVQIENRGFDFLIDTGVNGIAIDEDVARDLKLDSQFGFSNGANAGRYASRIVEVPQMNVGALRMRRVAAMTIPHLQIEGPGYRVVGMLGFDFIAAADLKLDYAGRTVTAVAPASFVPPLTGRAVALNIRLSRGVPMIDAAINDAAGDRFFIDTGAPATVIVRDAFAQRYPAALIDPQTTPEVVFAGAGGSFVPKAYHVSELRLGPLLFRDVVAYRITSAGTYDDGCDGVIGTALLKRFTVYTDYPHSKIYLEPNNVRR